MDNVGIFVIHVWCAMGNGNAVVKLGFPLTEIQKGKTHVNGIRGSTLYFPNAGTSMLKTCITTANGMCLTGTCKSPNCQRTTSFVFFALC